MFAPSFFLAIGILPFWGFLRHQRGFQAALRGVNAAVVGLLLAALYNPVWVSTVRSNADLVPVLVAFGLLFVGRMPPWVMVLATGGGGAGWYAVTHAV